MNKTDIRIKQHLLNAYPDSNVSKITNSPLYTEIYNISKARSLDVISYLESLGFKYISKNIDLINEEIVIHELTKFFNGNSINRLGDIHTFDNTIYMFILEQSKLKDLTTTDYLKSLGFQINKQPSANYDIDALKRLKQDYNLNLSQIASILNTTKQNLDSKLKYIYKTDYEKIWQKEELTPSEISDVCSMIKDLTYTYISSSFNKVILLFNNKNNLKEKALFYKDNDTIKCIFKLPNEILLILQEYNFDIFTQKDLDFKKILYTLWQAQNSPTLDNLKLVDLDASIKAKISLTAKQKSMLISDYLQGLGFISTDKRKVSDKQLKQILTKYIIHDNIVRITTDSKDYQRLANLASNRGFGGLDNFISSLGFIYEKGRDTSNVWANHINTIQSRYIVFDNNIYISSFDPFYRTLSAFALNRGETLDSLLNQMGFQRFTNKHLLPDNYIMYDWKNDASERLDLSWNDTTLVQYLSEICNSQNEVYLDIKSYFYNVLFLISTTRNISINNLLASLGFKRTYDNTLLDIDSLTLLENTLTHNKTSFIENTLKELKEIQGSLKTTENTQTKVSRNQTLVKKLKQLYQYRCQICSTDSIDIPIIEKDNGELYVHVHHIQAISDALYICDDDTSSIDSYKNAIVVCSHHHSYIHYHHGGFKNIIFEDNMCFLEANNGARLKIHTNYHLSND